MNFREMSGLEVFRAMRDGKLPHPTMADTIPMRVTARTAMGIVRCGFFDSSA